MQGGHYASNPMQITTPASDNWSRRRTYLGITASSKDGKWDPLCSFLEIGNCPAHPFPETNSARCVQMQADLAAITPIEIVLFCLFYMFTTRRRHYIIEWVTKNLHKSLDFFTRSLLLGTAGSFAGCLLLTKGFVINPFQLFVAVVYLWKCMIYIFR
jgi:hypothetical protein